MQQDENSEQFWFKEGEIASLWSFLLSINWKEKWLMGVISFHLLCSLAIIFTRKHLNCQIIILCSLCALTLSSEKLNEFGAKNWKMFAKEQYFDYGGKFMSVIWCAPMVVNCILLVVMWLIQTGKLLIKTKQRQFLHVKGSKRTQHQKSE